MQFPCKIWVVINCGASEEERCGEGQGGLLPFVPGAPEVEGMGFPTSSNLHQVKDPRTDPLSPRCPEGRSLPSSTHRRH